MAGRTENETSGSANDGFNRDVFAANLKEARKRKHISQDRLSKLVFVSCSTISKYETGKKTPPVDTVMKLANVLEISIDELCGNRVQISHEDGITSINQYIKCFMQLCETNIPIRIRTQWYNWKECKTLTEEEREYYSRIENEIEIDEYEDAVEMEEKLKVGFTSLVIRSNEVAKFAKAYNMMRELYIESDMDEPDFEAWKIGKLQKYNGSLNALETKEKARQEKYERDDWQRNIAFDPEE